MQTIVHFLNRIRGVEIVMTNEIKVERNDTKIKKIDIKTEKTDTKMKRRVKKRINTGTEIENEKVDTSLDDQE